MDAALTFHEATNHVPGFVRDPRLLRFTRDDPANVPLTFKEYSGLPTIQLELAPPSREPPRAVDVLSRRSFEHGPFDAKALARVLAFSAGITRVVERGGRKRYMRAASSAHSYPDIYVISGPLDGIAAGVYYFHGLDLTLTRLREGDYRLALAAATADPSIARRSASLVIVGVRWRADRVPAAPRRALVRRSRGCRRRPELAVRASPRGHPATLARGRNAVGSRALNGGRDPLAWLGAEDESRVASAGRPRLAATCRNTATTWRLAR